MQKQTNKNNLNKAEKQTKTKQEKQENRDFFWYNSDQDERDVRTELIDNLNKMDSRYYFERDSFSLYS